MRDGLIAIHGQTFGGRLDARDFHIPRIASRNEVAQRQRNLVLRNSISPCHTFIRQISFVLTIIENKTSINCRKYTSINPDLDYYVFLIWPLGRWRTRNTVCVDLYVDRCNKNRSPAPQSRLVRVAHVRRSLTVCRNDA